MSNTPTHTGDTVDAAESRAIDIGHLPTDELQHYGEAIGVRRHPKWSREELIERVRARHELLLRLDREAMLDIVKWARIPVRRSASRDELGRQIATITTIDFEGLSDRGLFALALLRGLHLIDGEPRHDLERRLRKSEPVSEWIRRKRRTLVGKLLSRVIDDPGAATGTDNSAEEYAYLPEDKASRPAKLEREIAQRGIVGGLANKLRGAADDYVATKLDEIEERIDKKLNEIDRRLSDWRDREVANRLRIIRVTLLASIVVAVMSLAYSAAKSRIATHENGNPAASQPR